MEENYLKKELYERVQNDPEIFEFIQSGSLDGIWYWDLEKMENEWMSPRFWTNFGYDPSTKEHKSNAWQDLINQDDLKETIKNFEAHKKDPNQPYDQVVRYKKKDGSTAWVRCRGLIIRDEKGTPIRMIGAHNDVTELKKVEEELKNKNTELEEKMSELSAMNKAMTGRELKMTELKNEIKELKQKLAKK